jgi:hypothetical protein
LKTVASTSRSPTVRPCLTWPDFYQLEQRTVFRDNWNDLNHEDIGIIERTQAGRS